MPAWPTTQTKNNTVNYGDRDIEQSKFYNAIDYEAVYGGHFPNSPYRPAIYQQNWSGGSYWQTWERLDYPVTYRSYVVGQNANNTAALLEMRNRPAQFASAPIAISQYAINTQQVYVGSDYYG